MTGIMSVTGNADGEPAKVGVAWIDVLTGMMAGNGILAALFHRERTGEGQIIDLSLFDVALMAMVNQAQKLGCLWRRSNSNGSCTPEHRPLPSIPSQRRLVHSRLWQ